MLSALSFCIGLSLAQLHPSPSCRASFNQGENRVCFDTELWERILRERSSCFELRGKWREQVTPENDLDHVEVKSPKHFQLSFSATEATPRASESFLGSWRTRIERTRIRLSEILSHHDALGVLRQIALGESNFGKSELLRKLGFVHIMSVSGIHLLALAFIWGELFRRVGPHLGVSTREALALSRFITLLTWTIAWILCGGRFGMLRPIVICALRASSASAGFKWRRWAPLALALLVDLAMSFHNGEALSWDNSRWIYALSVGGGLLALELPFPHLAMAIGSWLFPALFEIYHAGWVSLATPFLSLVTIPIYSLVIYPALLLGCAFPNILSSVSRGSDFVMTSLLKIFLRPQAPVFWIIPKWGFYVGAFVGSVCFLAFHYRISKRVLVPGMSLILIVIGLISVPWRQATLAEAEEVIQIDVGQGDSAGVIYRPQEGAREMGLIDLGSHRALTETQWMDLMGKLGVSKISWIGLTHLDEDHSGGIQNLALVAPIRCLTTAASEMKAPRGEKYGKILEHFKIPLSDWNQSACIPFPQLSPPPPRMGAKNQNMGAIFVPLPQRAAYLSAGDAEESDEIRIGNWAHFLFQNRDRRILKLSHHGSRTSSMPEFLNATQPTEAWISVGANNRYGHPSPEVLERIGAFPGLKRIHRTDREGAIRSKNP